MATIPATIFAASEMNALQACVPGFGLSRVLAFFPVPTRTLYPQSDASHSGVAVIQSILASLVERVTTKG